MVTRLEEPDREEVYSWLSTVYRGSPGYLCIWGWPSRHSEFFEVATELDKAATYATERSVIEDVYAGTCTLNARLAAGRRGGSEDVLAMPGLRADIDVAGPAHKGVHYPPSVDTALAWLSEVEIEPTRVVNSGGGLQAWWLFDKPFVIETDKDRKRAKKLQARLLKRFNELGRERGWKVDSTQDLARVLRPPGTLNHKPALGTPVLVTIQATAGTYHTFEGLEQLLPEPEPVSRPERRAPPVTLTGDRIPASEILEKWSWNDILEPHGFFELRQRGTGVEWGHPAQTSPKGTPAATTDIKAPVFVLFSDSTADLLGLLTGEGRKQTKLRVYAILNHGGDDSAASKAIWAITYPGWTPGTGVRDALPNDHPQKNPAVPPIFTHDSRASEASEAPADHEWALPVPLLGGIVPPPFPLHTLPDWIINHAQGVADQIQVPVDLCVQITIGALATIAAGHMKVAVTDEWTEHLNLYLATAVGSGGGKSPADRKMTNVLKQFVKEREEQMSAQISEAELKRDLLSRQFEAAKAAAAKIGGDVDEALRAKRLLDAAPVPPSARMLVDDTTPEALTELLGRQGGALAIVSSEAALFDVICGAYSQKVNLDVFLKAWGGDQIIVDRKGGSDRKPTQINIQEALLTIAVTVQPHHLAELRKRPELAGRGFTARFMYSIPQDRRGDRDRSMVKARWGQPAKQLYEQTFLTIARRLASWQLPIQVSLTDDALDMFIAWMQKTERRIAPAGDLRHLAEWVAKQQASVVRVAGLIHVAEQRHHADSIDVDIMERAIEIGDYWAAHASAVAELWQMDGSVSLASRVLEWIQTRVAGKQAVVSLREIHQALRRSVGSSAELIEPLKLLEDHGHVRALFDGLPKTGRGTKSPEWAIYPGLETLCEDNKDSEYIGGVPNSPAPSPPPDPLAAPPPPPTPTPASPSSQSSCPHGSSNGAQPLEGVSLDTSDLAATSNLEANDDGYSLF